MKVMIITPCGLPVPAVKGGAVLTLVDSLINQNEISKKLQLSIISSFDNEALDVSKSKKKCSFVFIKKKKIINIIDNLYEKIYFLLTKKNHKTKKEYLWKFYLILKIRKILLTNDYDKLVFENSGFLLKVLKNKKIMKKYNNNCFFHIHNDIPDNIDLNSLNQCHIISISNYLKKKLLKITNNQYKKRFYLLKNGFDCSKFCKQLTSVEKEELLKSLGFNSNDKIIIFAGRVTPEKGIYELTEAFSRIKSKKFKLLVVGSHRFGDNQTSDFMNEMNKKFLELGDRVSFTGFVKYDEIWKYYHVSDLAVLPSIWQEPAGLTMLEATVCGIPLITTISGGIPEYLSEKHVTFVNNDNKLIDSLYNSILNFYNNQKQYKRKALEASKFVLNNYSEKIYYDNFINIMFDSR